MIERVRGLVRRLLGGPDASAFPSPPWTFEDARGREIELRPYDDGAFEPLVSMYATFDPAQRAQGTPPAGEASVREWLERLLAGVSVVAWHGDRAVGHVAIVPDGEGGHELAVYVHRDYQRAGIGTELVRTGLGLARDRGIGDVWLSVERWKRGAQRLYRRVGFRVDDPTGTALRMSRRL